MLGSARKPLGAKTLGNSCEGSRAVFGASFSRISRAGPVVGLTRKWLKTLSLMHTERFVKVGQSGRNRERNRRIAETHHR